MKYISALIALLLPVLITKTQSNIYSIENTTSATIVVTLKPAYLFSSDVDVVIEPGKTLRLKVGKRCIGSIVVRGISEPLALVKASFLMPEDPGTIFMTDIERNHCSNLSLVVEHQDYKYVDPTNVGVFLEHPDVTKDIIYPNTGKIYVKWVNPPYYLDLDQHESGYYLQEKRD